VKLSGLSLRDVRGLADQRLSFSVSPAARPSDLVLVTGAPGSGKTRFLEAVIAAFEVTGPYLGIVRGEDWAYGARPGSVELQLWLDDEERALAPTASTPALAAVTFSSSGATPHIDRTLSRLLSRYDHAPGTSKREYFADNRQLAWGARSDGLEPLEQSLLRPTRDPHKYAFLPRFLTSLRADEARARAFAEKLELLSPTVRYRPAADADATICFRSRSGEGILAPARGLSSSEAEAVVIAATATLVGLNRSIVFLDTPELFVPEDHVVGFVQGLLKLGHDNQWVVATQSPALLAASDPTCIVRLEPRTGGAR
jgi:hypothetical protein